VMTVKEARGLLPRHPNCMCSYIPANVGESKKGQVRTRRDLRRAVRESVRREMPKLKKRTLAEQLKRTTWPGPDTVFKRVRPRGVLDKAAALRPRPVFGARVPTRLPRRQAARAGVAVDEGASPFTGLLPDAEVAALPRSGPLGEATAQAERRLAKLIADRRASTGLYKSMASDELLEVQKNFQTGWMRSLAQTERTGGKLTATEAARLAEGRARLKAINAEIKRRREIYDLMRQARSAAESARTGKIALFEGDVAKLLAKPKDRYWDAGWRPKMGKPPYRPELFIKSDISGKPMRHYVKLPDGRLAHPDELKLARQRGNVVVFGKAKAPKAINWKTWLVDEPKAAAEVAPKAAAAKQPLKRKARPLRRRAIVERRAPVKLPKVKRKPKAVEPQAAQPAKTPKRPYPKTEPLTPQDFTATRFEINQTLATGRLDVEAEQAVAKLVKADGPMAAAAKIKDTKNRQLLVRVQRIIGPRRGNGAKVENPADWRLVRGVWQEKPAKPVKVKAPKAKADTLGKPRKRKPDLRVRRETGAEIQAAVKEVAADYEVDQKLLRDVLDQRHADEVAEVRRRQGEIDALRKQVGLTTKQVQAVEDAGFDWTPNPARLRAQLGGTKKGEQLAKDLLAASKRMDEFGSAWAREYPGLIGDPDDPKAELMEGIWELMRVEKQPLPLKTDSRILHAAAEEAAELQKYKAAATEAAEEMRDYGFGPAAGGPDDMSDIPF